MSVSPEKAQAAQLGWRIHLSESRFRSDVFQVRQDVLEVNGEERSYSYVERPAAVIIVPVTPAGQIVTVRQYRYPIDEWCIEVPAGGTHDTGDESLREVALSELREEVGGTPETLSHVESFYTSPSLTTEKCHVFFAENVRLIAKPQTETTEEIEIELRSAAEITHMARSGQMKNAPCALAILICEPLLRSRGYLE